MELPSKNTIAWIPMPCRFGKGDFESGVAARVLADYAENPKLYLDDRGKAKIDQVKSEMWRFLREALEETGVACQAVALVGVFDSRFCGTTSVHQLYQFTFLCKPTGETTAASHAHEVLQTRWFAENELPPNIDAGHITRIPIAFQVWRGESQAFFDQVI